ncbi:MAG: tetratricopeptide repeat protein [Wenzhouxiangellaceae bacterium]|nr:tetratricopeptide repeat protein [Wenzhouxiangellaceae bacterium]
MSTPDAGLSRLAIKHYQSGQFREAEQMFRKLIEVEPDNWQYALLLGLSRHSQGDFNDALKWIRRSVELGDGQSATHFYYGRLLSDRRQWDAAREQFAQAIALNPNHVEARTGMGMVSLMAGNLQRGITELKTALRANEAHVPALAGLARALVEQGDAAAASPYAVKALELDGKSVPAQDAMGRVFLAQGHVDFARQCFENALEIQPDSGELHAGLAEALKARRLDREALEHYTVALRKDYGGAGVVIAASICLERLSDMRQARELVARAHERWPEDRDVALRLAELNLLAGHIETARGLLDGLDPAAPGVAMMNARVADASGDTKAACSVLKTIIANDSAGKLREPRLLLARLTAAIDPNNPAAARSAIEPLLEKQPADADALLAWATICDRAGDPSQAAQVLEELLARDNIEPADRAPLHSRLARFYDHADQPALAYANLNKGTWRLAPHVLRLDSQYTSGQLSQWLALEHWGLKFGQPDDGLPSPVIVVGWPGSGRELLLAALAEHSGVFRLEPSGEDRRLEALGLPASPRQLMEAGESISPAGRKRFMRGVDRERLPAVVLEAGWWSASSIPALAHVFPGTTVLWPQVHERDLEMQWRLEGYREVDLLLQEYRREQQLWERMREHLPLNIVTVERAGLLADPAQALGPVCQALGLDLQPAMTEAAERVLKANRFFPDGRWQRYQPVKPATSAAAS